MVYVVKLVGEALNKTLNKESGARLTGWVHSVRVAVPGVHLLLLHFTLLLSSTVFAHTVCVQ